MSPATPLGVSIPVVDCLKLFNNNFICYTCFPAWDEENLEHKMKNVQQRKEDTEIIFRNLEASGVNERSSEVSSWMTRVDSVNKQVDDLLEKLSHTKRYLFSCFCFKSNYKNGKDVDKLLRRIKSLKEERGGWGKHGDLVVPKIPQLRAESTQQPRSGEEQPGSEDDPWDMFCKSTKGGRVDLNNPIFQHHAKAIVIECRGLPQALPAVGRAVRNYQSREEWEYAIQRLKNPPTSHQPVSGNLTIESILRFCYDGLDNEQLRSCLLFCALFPKNHNICECELILNWIGEGLLDAEDKDGSSDFYNAYEKGLSIIRKLVDVSLLDYSRDWCDFYLRMPKDVWDMAQQITDGDGNPYVVYTKKSGQLSTGIRAWASAMRVSTIELDPSLPGANIIFNSSADGNPSSDTDYLPEVTPLCHRLTTFLAAGNKKLERIHQDFFRFVPILRVLVLSSTNIKEIPRTITLLTTLRYLNLKNTMITKLPIELGDLQNLKMLDLTDTRELKEITAVSISGLSTLQILRMSDTAYSWDLPLAIQNQPNLMQHSRSALLKLDDLANLEQMHTLWLTLRSIPTLELLLKRFVVRED